MIILPSLLLLVPIFTLNDFLKSFNNYTARSLRVVPQFKKMPIVPPNGLKPYERSSSPSACTHISAQLSFPRAVPVDCHAATDMSTGWAGS